MPQAIATAIVAAIGLTGTAAAIATAVIALAVTIGLNYIAMQLFAPGVAKPSDGQRVIRQNVGSRVRHYGKVRIGGQLSFYESRDGTLYILITTSQGKLNAIIEVLINGKLVTVDGSGLVTDAKFRNAVSVHTRMGTDDQAAYSELSSIFSEYTSDHRQRGCGNALVIARGVKDKYFSEVYEGNREPELTITYETTAVYDPRKDDTAVVGYDEVGDPIMGSGSHRVNSSETWEYSDNWALCFADYLAHPDGYGMGYDAINWVNIAEEAAICDLTVETVDARTIPQWRVAGSYKMADDERRTVVKEFLKAGDGFMFQDADGLANIRCGRWIAPTVHIPEKHIIGCAASLGTDAQDRANEVRVIYMEPRLDYTETEAAPLVDVPARLALGRGEVSRFDCYFCPDHNQAQRIGKRILKRLGDRWALTITTNLFGLNAIGERFITVTISELGITELSFEVTSIKIDPARLNVSIGLLEAKEEDFSFNATEEEGTPPGDVPSTSVPIVIEEIANLTLSAAEITLSGGSGVGILATWDAPTRPDLIAQVQFRAAGDSDWLEMNVSQDDRTALAAITSTGIEYEVRARNITIAGRPSEWCDIETITPEATTEAIIPPFELTATPTDSDSVEIRYRQPRTLLLDYSHVLADETAVIGSAAQVGADQYGAGGDVVTITEDSIVAGPRSYWAVAYDDDGNDAAIGPVSINVGGFSFAGGVLPAGASLTRSGAKHCFNSSGVLTSYATDVAAFDHRWNGSAWVLAGVLVEPSRENRIRNSVLAGSTAGVIGSGGVMPTNGSFLGSATGIAREVVGAGTEDGMGYVDLRISGTSSNGGFADIYFEATNQSAAVTGDVFTASCFVKLVGGTLTGVDDIELTMSEYNSGLGVLAVQEGAHFTPTSTRQRFESSFTCGNASTAYSRMLLRVDTTGGATLDITLRVYQPQFELGSGATSPIPTSGAKVTRNADALVLDWATGRHVPDGAMTTRYGFDDATTQDVVTTVASGTATVPTTLNRHAILSAQKVS